MLSPSKHTNGVLHPPVLFHENVKQMKQVKQTFPSITSPTTTYKKRVKQNETKHSSGFLQTKPALYTDNQPLEKQAILMK